MNSVFFVWAVAYSIVYRLADILDKALKTDYKTVPICMLLFTVIFLYWIFKSGKAEYIGVKKAAISKNNIYMAIPLLMFPLYNIMVTKQVSADVYDILLILSAIVVEEVFFRGVIQKHFLHSGLIMSVLITNLLFAGYHSFNIFSGADIYYTLWQVLNAFIVGVCYSLVVILYDSLIPAAAAHFLVNLTGMYKDTDLTGISFIVAIHIIYALFLLKKAKNNYDKREK